jgi:hypothetical protein
MHQSHATHTSNAKRKAVLPAKGRLSKKKQRIFERAFFHDGPGERYSHKTLGFVRAINDRETGSVSLNSFIRRHPDLNWGINDLQSSALPLGYAALKIEDSLFLLSS